MWHTTPTLYTNISHHNTYDYMEWTTTTSMGEYEVIYILT
jgi:hypothetical protein